MHILALNIVTLLLAVVHAAPARLEARFGDSYTPFSGNGSPSQGWPSRDAWGSFDQLWNANFPLMQQSCGWNGWGPNNSPTEIAGIKTAINQVAGETGLTNRLILAVVMQESKGCVRVPTTTSPDGSVRNPGLMQSHNGPGSCAGTNPCTQDRILQMIRDGAAGTASGNGLEQTVGRAVQVTGDHGTRSTYAGAREYNSGSVDYNNLNNAYGATACYAQDVANRLTGWTLAPSRCSV